MSQVESLNLPLLVRRVGQARPGSRRAQFARCVRVGVTVLGWLALAGCIRREPAADVVIINFNEPESLDPAIVTGIPEMRITRALFEGLLRLDAKAAEPVPGLAEKWDISPDGKRYTFYLRTNLAWSTGRSLTTSDVVYSWMRALSPATAGDYAGEFFYIKNAEAYYNGKVKNPGEVGIQALDAQRLQVDLEQPVAFFFELCALPAFAVVLREAIENW